MKIRPGDSKIFQIVRRVGKAKIPSGGFALIGVPDDRGVAIGGGRTGAKHGPDAIRKELFKMTLGLKGELEKIKLWDFGNLKLEKTQEAIYKKLNDLVLSLLEKNVFPIILGGGHDLSFGSLGGFLKKYPRGGIINIDPHLDCRPPEAKGKYSSGTAFHNLIEKSKLPGKNLLEFGYQPHCNAKKHFEYLKKSGVKFVPFASSLSLRGPKGALGIPVFKKFFNKTALAISFDMDSVQALDAPGVSALAPIGYTAREALVIVQTLAHQKNMKMFEIMEVNPRFDPDHRTAKLAARLIFEILLSRI
ncbi:MAG: formimidoylglutamase [Deltaproteobacteria bacterium]|nr:formimidoylglutamase [Deltaproteobacteria bacterium]